MNDHSLNNSLYRKKMVLAGLLLSFIITVAQTKTGFAVDVQGKQKRSSDVYKFIKSFNATSDAKAASLARTATKIQDAVCSLPQLNPPKGFDANNGVATYELELKEKEPFLKIFCYLRYLKKDAHTATIKESMDGADLDFDINAFDLFNQIGNYWEECDKLKLPVFFEALPITDSTADYIQTTIKGRTVRIVTTDKTLFVPLTRKEFFQFLIARDNFRIKENQRFIKDDKKLIDDNKKNTSNPVYAPIKSALEQTIPTLEEQVKKVEKEIESLQQKVAHFAEVMNAMTTEEANAPVRMDYNKRSDELFGLEQLVPAGRMEGVQLVRVNPAYYNHSANAPAAQLITVYYAWPTIGFQGNPDYVQQTALDIFRQLDYHALKMSMQ